MFLLFLARKREKSNIISCKINLYIKLYIILYCDNIKNE